MTEIAKKPSIFIENQFPAIYREEARELITIVEAYYEFLETQTNQSIYNVRNMFECRDIDTTLLNMLIFYRNKYLKGLPFDQTNIRFIVKNVMELYRRKGSKEGIELFFKMFYDEEVEIYYPSYEMLKPSTSSWKVGKYLQLYPVDDVTIFSDIVNKKIYGSVSNTYAFVDKVYFVKVNKSLLPVIFISNAKGTFAGGDVIFTIEPIRKEYGRVYGSLERLGSVGTFEATQDNQVGDIVTITSETGRGATARVSSVAENLSGEIQFTLQNGEYGYTVDGTTILLSNQSIFLDNTNLDFIVYERVAQDVGANTHFATVVGQDKQSVGLLLDDDQEAFVEGEFYTIQREENITKDSLFVLSVNSTASASVGSIRDTEEIEIIVDLIEDFADVPLNSVNFSTVPPAQAAMTGGSANITTPLNSAFVPQNLSVGYIDTLSGIDPGQNYENNVFVLARENFLSKFNYKDQIISYSTNVSNINLLVGDIILQNKEVLTFAGQTIQRMVKGKVVARQGNTIQAKQLSFEPFIKENTFYKQGTTTEIEIVSLSRTNASLPLGLNAEITGSSVFLPGKILSVDVIDSGIGYEHNDIADMNNTTKSARYKELLDNAIKNGDDQNNIDAYQSNYDTSLIEISAQGIIKARSEGKTEGSWQTYTSHLNTEDGKVLQDSFYYQDYSYEISSSLNEEIYLESLKDIAHPVGTKMFSTFSNLSRINNSIEIYSTLSEITITEYILSNESETSVITSEDGSQYIVSTI